MESGRGLESSTMSEHNVQLLWLGQEQEGEMNDLDICFTVWEMKATFLPTDIQTVVLYERSG